jgi:molecular chaperone GrpE
MNHSHTTRPKAHNGEHDESISQQPESTPSQKAASAAPPLAISHPSYEELESKLNEVEAQLNEANSTLLDHKNQLLRAHAELENIRKRAQKDVESAHRYGLERFILELLPVIDSLERGLSIEVGDNEFAKQIHAGLEMTLKLFMDTLEKSSVRMIDPLGKDFDPSLHQAISMQEKADLPANSVIAVLQKGYQLHDRLIRPALVVVAQ